MPEPPSTDGTFVDDFDDGVFADGSDGRPEHWSVGCGSLGDADERDGWLIN